MNHPLCLHREITYNSLDRSAACATRNSKGILFVSTDCNNLPFPASIGPRFIGSLNLSIYRLRKIWFAAMALATSASIAAAEAAVDPAAVRKT
jgi:hypothetical protein